MASTTITFAIPAGASITIRAPAPGSSLRPARQQVANAAVGGRIVVSNIGTGSSLDQPNLQWVSPGMSRSDRDDLVDFIENEADRRSTAFVFTDWYGNDRTVRYWTGVESIRELGHSDRWIGTIELREVPT